MKKVKKWRADRLCFLLGAVYFLSRSVLAQGDLYDKAGLLAVSPCSATVPAQNPLGEDYHLFEGKIIAAIRFLQVDVFDLNDPSENNRLYALVNKLHFNTRASTIAPQLLFVEGDTVNSAILAESERLLRAQHYLSNAQITVDDVCGEEVALLVKTRDIWTTELEVSLGHQGGETKHGFGVSEGNIFGTGNSIAIGYNKTLDRSSVSYGFHSPHLFNTRLTSDISFTETSDGQESHFVLINPFYSLQTPWAAGVASHDVVEKEIIRSRGEIIDEYRHGSERQELFTGFSLKANFDYTHRLSLGVSQERNIYEELPLTDLALPGNENLVYPWLEYRFIENQFAVYQNLNQMHLVEDLSMGADLQLRVGYAGAMYGNSNDAWRYHLRYNDLLGVGEHHLIKYSISADGYAYTDPEIKGRSLWGGNLGYYYLLGDKHRIFVYFDYRQGHNLLLHDELNAGGEPGLRGYPLGYQRGDRRYLLTLEKRYITDWHIFNLFRLGAVTFVDFGRAWGAGYENASHLSNVGVGLRVSSSKAKVGNIVHIDLAFPLADKQQVDEYQWVVSASRSL